MAHRSTARRRAHATTCASALTYYTGHVKLAAAHLQHNAREPQPLRKTTVPVYALVC
jgi:hypothetical protein